MLARCPKLPARIPLFAATHRCLHQWVMNFRCFTRPDTTPPELERNLTVWCVHLHMEYNTTQLAYQLHCKHQRLGRYWVSGVMIILKLNAVTTKCTEKKIQNMPLLHLQLASLPKLNSESLRAEPKANMRSSNHSTHMGKKVQKHWTTEPTNKNNRAHRKNQIIRW